MSDTSRLVRHTSTALLIVLSHPCSCFYQFPNQLLASKKVLQFVTDILRLLSDKFPGVDGDRVANIQDCKQYNTKRLGDHTLPFFYHIRRRK